jgi:AcrR family transcriptional regulator
MLFKRQPLLDAVAEILVANPAASLAEVAQAAGIGRTTLHKHYATRDDLIRAVGHRAIHLWRQAVETVHTRQHPDGGLRALVDAMVPIGPQLAFLWRTPAFDHMPEIAEPWKAVEQKGLGVLRRAQTAGLIAPDVPQYWLLQTLYSLVYVAAESVQSGHLASRSATDLVLRTLLNGIGAPQTP